MVTGRDGNPNDPMTRVPPSMAQEAPKEPEVVAADALRLHIKSSGEAWRAEVTIEQKTGIERTVRHWLII